MPCAAIPRAKPLRHQALARTSIRTKTRVLAMLAPDRSPLSAGQSQHGLQTGFADNLLTCGHTRACNVCHAIKQDVFLCFLWIYLID
jgi:hypothetical protein